MTTESEWMLSVEDLPETQIVFVDENGNVINSIKYDSLIPDNDAQLHTQISEGIKKLMETYKP